MPKEHLEEESLSLKGAFIGGIVVTIIIALSVGAFSWINTSRRNEIIKTYDESVEKYVADNPTTLAQLFNETFLTCSQQVPKQNVQGSQYNIECQAAITQLNALNKNALKNSSATTYLRVHDGKADMIDASGKYHSDSEVGYSYRYRENGDMKSYLFEGKDINRWQDFSWNLPGKEVVSPVKINGQTVGYMFLSVIEK